MKKLYAGLAAAAMTATGIACTAGAAHATVSPWPTSFEPNSIATTTDAGTYLFGNSEGGEATALVYVDADGSPQVVNRAGVDELASAGNTAFAVGQDTNGVELWALSNGAVTTTTSVTGISWESSLAISPDGTQLAVVGLTDARDYIADIFTITGGALTGPRTVDLGGANSGSNQYGVVQAAFSPADNTLYAASWDNSGSTPVLWSIGTTDTTADPTPFAAPDADLSDDDVSAITVGHGDAGDTAYVTVGYNGGDLIAVRGGEVVGTQPLDSGVTDLTLGADGSTLYGNGNYGGVYGYAVDQLGSYDDDNPAPSFSPAGGESSYVPGALTTGSNGSLVIAEYDNGDTPGDPIIDTLTAPGAPSGIAATRGDTWGDVSFTASTSTGSSAWNSADDLNSIVTYTVTLHDVTNPSTPDVVHGNVWDGSDVAIGYDDGPQLVPGDAYTVSVTASNGLFSTPAAATFALGKYVAPAPTPTPAQQPVQVTQIKPATIKASAKKVKLTLPGLSAASAPGKVKVYDGKKLVGTAKIVNGKLVVKLKKHLSHGQHKLKLSYKGSAQVAKFNKKVKIKVK